MVAGIRLIHLVWTTLAKAIPSVGLPSFGVLGIQILFDKYILSASSVTWLCGSISREYTPVTATAAVKPRESTPNTSRKDGYRLPS